MQQLLAVAVLLAGESSRAMLDSLVTFTAL